MLINEVMEKTGLSKKAIRFYESRELIRVDRMENGYRSYTEDDILTLNKIKSLRMCGVSVSDIKLLFGNIVTIDELMQKRKKELESEFGIRSAQAENIISLLSEYKTERFDTRKPFDEAPSSGIEASDQLIVGLDIGTTSVSAAVIDVKNHAQLESYTIANSADLRSGDPRFHEQDAEMICSKAARLLDLIIDNYPAVRAIGLTGQMHGIVYTDKNGGAVSELITWQDKRGDIVIENGRSCCDMIYEQTGCRISTGYGFATHCFNRLKHIVPPEAVSFCSIMDYLAMKLAGLTLPVIHSSDAASFGLFDLKSLRFDAGAVSKLGMDDLTLPEVTDDFCILGTYRGIPVSVAIGDNQASFIGAVPDIDDSILVNIGTGSQISTASDYPGMGGETELRPLIRGKYISCGSALCGGKAYALLESFFRSYMLAASGEDRSQYDIINRLAVEAYAQKSDAPIVGPYFLGKRSDPGLKASITGLTDDNFTPGRLALGVITGICRELYDFMPDGCRGKKYLIASGNAVRKIPIMKSVLEDVFGLPVRLSVGREEAAVGAALFAAVSAHILDNICETSDFIKTEESSNEQRL